MADLKAEIAALFQELSELTQLHEATANSFRVRAYENAVDEIRTMRGDIATMTVAELVSTRGIGKSSAQKIRQYVETGKIDKLEELRAQYPADYVALSRLGGLGPKKLKILRATLGIENIDDMRAAIAEQKIRVLKGFGQKTEENLAKSVQRFAQGNKASHRTPIGKVLPLAERLAARLGALPEVVKITYCGSLRRMRETIGDVDLLASSLKPAPIMKAFVEMSDVEQVLAQGETKSSVIMNGGLQVDLRVVKPKEYGAAVMYFTGSKAFNIRLRQRAISRGWLLNEYALAQTDGKKVVASTTEQAIFKALDLAFVPAPMREDTGEVELAAEGALPKWIESSHLRGDLHVHTSLSKDAKSSLQDVLKAAHACNYQYVAITEHGEDLQPSGVNQLGLLAQKKSIAELQTKYPKMKILHGCELNIGKAGQLDYDADFRNGLDFCIAGIHSHFDLDAKQQTERLLIAMNDPSVRAIAHISCRLLGKRPAIEFEVDTVLREAAKTKTAIELNSGLHRLDASAELLRRARDLDVLFTLSSDAHSTQALHNVHWGALYGQRGWLDRDRVVNTWPTKKFLTWAGR